MSRSIIVEQKLDAEGVQWRYIESVPLEDIDLDASLKNQARIGEPLDEHLVETYALAMQEGAVFPAIVGHRGRSGKYVLNGGNHRAQGAKRIDRPDFDMYEVLSADAWVQDRITRSLNSIEGKRESREAAIAHAKWLVRTYNRTAIEVAKSFGLDPNVLRDAMRADEGRRRLESLGADTTHFSSGTLIRLNVIPSNPAMTAAASFVKEAALPAADQQKLVTEVRAKRTEAEQLATVEAWRSRQEYQDRVAAVGKGRVARPKQSEKFYLFRDMQSVINRLRRHTSYRGVGLTTDADIERFDSLWSQQVAEVNKLRGVRNGTGPERTVNNQSGLGGREAAHTG